jgi:hypothetical protein
MATTPSALMLAPQRSIINLPDMQGSPFEAGNLAAAKLRKSLFRRPYHSVNRVVAANSLPKGVHITEGKNVFAGRVRYVPIRNLWMTPKRDPPRRSGLLKSESGGSSFETRLCARSHSD